MSGQSKRLKDEKAKINIRLWLEDVEFAKSRQHLFPGMSYQAVLREMCTQGRKVMERAEKAGETVPLPRQPVLKG